MRALLLAAALLAPLGARAGKAPSPWELLESAEPAERAAACAELARPPHQSTASYAALSRAMRDDLSDRVRLAAGVATLAFPGGATLAAVEGVLKTEPGAEIRRGLIVALATAPAHADNPDATRMIAAALADDADKGVRRAAAAALATRNDPAAVGAVRRASADDADKGVREAAARAFSVLSIPPKAKPKKKAPKRPDPEGVKGHDACPLPWGWCECSGVVRVRPQCLTTKECRTRNAEMQHYNVSCTWNGSDLGSVE
ncbi:MAG: HEAT repeat domain-containing protein [Elusimicrobia bacterium]|nr:HEAT repeat domain-containing protein [Elusimicrobiota bacterium]